MACCTVSGLHIVTPLFCNTFASTITISDAVRMQQPNTKRSLEPRHSCGYLSPKPSVTESTFTLEADVLSLRPSPNPPASTQLGGAEWEGTPFGPYPVGGGVHFTTSWAKLKHWQSIPELHHALQIWPQLSSHQTHMSHNNSMGKKTSLTEHNTKSALNCLG